MLGSAGTDEAAEGRVPSELRLTKAGRELLVTAVSRFALGLILVFALFPIWMMVMNSFKPRSAVMTENPSLVPRTFHPSNYVEMWSRFPLVEYFTNSLIIASATTVVSLLVASLAAYAFSRYDFPGKSKLELSILGTQMIPGVLILLPMYLLFINVQIHVGLPMKDTYHGLVFLYSTFTVPFAIWMLRGYFDTIPEALEEAARIDGCTRLGALFRVVMPLAAPGIAATGMFVFLMAFNEVLFASVLGSENVTPFAIGIQQFETQSQTYWGQMMAASTVATVPLLLLFVLFQKPIVAGLTTGSVKE
ncbi:carbohydrate ABC transporter permease [Haloarchaeobius iranensis]|uniref:Multiple sugar transport system permease protein n=1 Tax=Haloarchaeobius iranensis TaxID=996166 RepID=A0A1G9UWK0_9EURY|nr:carbohydrate ABC transporter permease [Haloarchaeobius iranensis]SDM64302.1 multiple sugar transport system permease protein [Haloarchaeobius iranensis]